MVRFVAILTSGNRGLGEKDSFSPASSFIELVEFDENGKTMDITFRSGSKIRYVNVYPSTFLSFKKSPTHSAYYARAVKGNLMSAKIVDQGIGRKDSMPMQKMKKENLLDAGLAKHLARRAKITGTVTRALNAAAITD
jgi:hypothetical protein